MDIEQSVAQYRDLYPVYERFTNKVQGLLNEVLLAHNMDFSIEHRTKDIEHFREKITRQGKSYEDPLTEITDVCGVRIIVRRTTDVSKVIEIIKAEFSIDEKNSAYKAEELNVDQFGYTSVHLVTSLDTGRASLTEWKLFEQLKAEIQIRTILQHAWAVISHTFDYKVGTDIPREFRRRLFRLSALFELADEELDQLVDNIQERIQNYKKSIDLGNAQIELNVDSLRAYIETSPNAQYWIKHVRDTTGQSVDTSGDLSHPVKFAKFCGAQSIEDVNHIIVAARGWGEKFLKDYFNDVVESSNISLESIGSTQGGIILILIIASNAEKLTDEILEVKYNYAHSAVLDLALKARGIAR